ncbi:GrpB family protein [Vibrio makurazakiensis]|uniref:GrpB family protein n=1 Tax=Vibrio makurazakiensis TaxID=2910250 RepID=UPI003D124D36
MRFYSSEEYQSSCAELYRKYQHEIQTMLPDAVIEHIGSSSIPMTVSKGDLDILVGVNGTNELGEAVKVLATLGFNEKHGLSKVRNEVNYTHSMGAWFPYSSSQSEHEKMFRLTQLWKQPPSDEFIKTHLTQCDQLLR